MRGRPKGGRKFMVDYNPKNVSITIDQYATIKNKYGNTHYQCECGIHEPCGRTNFLDFLFDLMSAEDKRKVRGSIM